MIKKISLLLITLALSGCLGGYSPQSNFYRIQPLSSDKTAPISTKKLSVGINMPQLPEYLDKPQIISFDANSSQMNIDELNRWGEPLDSMIQRTIAQDISLYLPKSVVKAKSSLLEKFNLMVDIQIIRLDMIKKDKAVLSAWWFISNSSQNILTRQKTTLTSSIDNNYNSYVNALTQLFGKLSKEIADKLITY